MQHMEQIIDKEQQRKEYAFIHKLTKKFRKALNKYELIENDDHILIGLSGGKDSLALVEFLGKQMQIFVPRFRVTAVHISVRNIGYQTDTAYLENYCRQFNVPFVHHVTEFDETIEPEKNICFPCSWFRRKALFRVAQELDCNKIALGHHQDDIVETLLMNLFYQGSFGTMPPKLKMDKFEMTMIRPFCYLSEAELVQFAEMRNYKKQIRNCPYERNSQRSEMKQLLNQLKAINPNINKSVWNAMENIKTKYLP